MKIKGRRCLPQASPTVISQEILQIKGMIAHFPKNQRAIALFRFCVAISRKSAIALTLNHRLITGDNQTVILG